MGGDEHGNGAERHDVVVIGGGLAGLSAAWHLRDRDVVVLEASDRVGGRIRSEARGDVWLNFGAHVFGGVDSETGVLLAALGLTATELPGRLAAIAMGGKVLASGAVETYPLRLPLSTRSRLALMRAGLRLRFDVRAYGKVAAPRPGEDAATRQERILRFLDDASFSERYGSLPADVAEMFRCTLSRSSGEPHELAAGYGIGYFHQVWNRSEGLARGIIGGPSMLTAGLAAALGDRVRLGASATSVEPDGDGVTVRATIGGVERTLSCAHVVVAAPAHVARAIVRGLPADTEAALGAIRYGPYAVGSLLVNASARLPWHDLYALATPGRSFSMLFNPANVLTADPSRRPTHGSVMVYAAADQARALLVEDDAAIARRFADDVVALFPEVRGRIEETVIQRWSHGTPYPHVGRGALQPALMRDLGRVHLAGDYLGSWYTETAAASGARAARAIGEAAVSAPTGRWAPRLPRRAWRR